MFSSAGIPVTKVKDFPFKTPSCALIAYKEDFPNFPLKTPGVSISHLKISQSPKILSLRGRAVKFCIFIRFIPYSRQPAVNASGGSEIPENRNRSGSGENLTALPLRGCVEENRNPGHQKIPLEDTNAVELREQASFISLQKQFTLFPKNRLIRVYPRPAVLSKVSTDK
ncbi:MAG: hypothetical protein B6245_00630 [Desulfobacteraceae bacterium 4572_88]|nr:MAG: hypothetical protein B6245_00630 [Desulfobacteraceae bacterium 4572_88]